MELSDKIIQNLFVLSCACLRNEKVAAEPAAMAELWADVAQAKEFLDRPKGAPVPMAVMPS